MPLNTRQLNFAQNIASGLTAGRAYEQAGYSARGNGADVNGCKLLKRADVAAEVERLRKQSAEDCRWTRKRGLDFLCDVLETPIGKINADHVLAQEHQAATLRVGERLKMPAKIDAFRELAKMLGWYEPEKHQLEVEVIIGGNAESQNQD